jgi:hypothetical protein
MPRLGRLAQVAFVLCVCSCLANASASDGRALRVENFTLKTFEGQDHRAELGRITVPENHHSKSQRGAERMAAADCEGGGTWRPVQLYGGNPCASM